jgi:hypothetical protein
LAKYGTPTPPTFDLHKIDKVPVAMFVAGNDSLAPPDDTRWLKTQVPSTIYYEEIPNFDHRSFLIGKNMTFMDNVLKVVGNQLKLDQAKKERVNYQILI